MRQVCARFLMIRMIAATYLPIFVGAVLGAIGSLVFIVQSRAFPNEEVAEGPQSRQAAVRRVLVIYASIAWVCLVAAVVIGDVTFIVMTGVITVLASAGVVVRWSS